MCLLQLRTCFRFQQIETFHASLYIRTYIFGILTTDGLASLSCRRSSGGITNRKSPFRDLRQKLTPIKYIKSKDIIIYPL